MAMDDRYAGNAGAIAGIANRWRTCRPLSAIRQSLLHCSTSGSHAVASAFAAFGLPPVEIAGANFGIAERRSYNTTQSLFRREP
jgi:hypothetical protein